MSIDEIMERARPAAVRWNSANSGAVLAALAAAQQHLTAAMLSHLAGGSATGIHYVDDGRGRHRPTGTAVELADAVLRIAHACQVNDIPLVRALAVRINYDQQAEATP